MADGDGGDVRVDSLIACSGSAVRIKVAFRALTTCRLPGSVVVFAIEACECNTECKKFTTKNFPSLFRHTPKIWGFATAWVTCKAREARPGMQIVQTMLLAKVGRIAIKEIVSHLLERSAMLFRGPCVIEPKILCRWGFFNSRERSSMISRHSRGRGS